MEDLVSVLADRPEWFAFLLPYVLECDEPDTRWQFAVTLGYRVLPFTEAEGALLRLVEDHHEYVSRMALQAIGRIGSTHTESLCERAWATNHEYQRIMALWVLKEIGSQKLGAYVALAKKDARKYVVSNALEIESAHNQALADGSMSGSDQVNLLKYHGFSSKLAIKNSGAKSGQ
jgi:hypothetical protein